MFTLKTYETIKISNVVAHVPLRAVVTHHILCFAGGAISVEQVRTRQ